MAFDGYFKGDKVVRPPSRHPPSRPYKPPRKLPNPMNPRGKPMNPRFRETKPPAKPSTPPGPSPQPSSQPLEPGYGTAVPTTPQPIATGVNRSDQFLRWFGPAVFDNWDYIYSFRYLLHPIKRMEDEWSVPAGWRTCGKLKGSAIPRGLGYWSPKWQPKDVPICGLLPIGGQWIVDPSPGPANSYLFQETTGELSGKPIGTSWGFMWKPDNVPAGGVPQLRPGRQVWSDPAPDTPRQGLPRPQPGVPPRPLPWALQPGQASAPHPSMGPTRAYESEWPIEPPIGKPDVPRPVAPTNPHVPPGPRTKERKAKVPPWFAALSKVAWEATEAVDVVDNLFECLPKKVQKKAPKTGVTLPDAWKPGIKYTTVIDRAKHVYNNINSLDLDCAMRKLSCNHIEDMLWGRFFGIADDNARAMGLKGYGMASGSMSGLRLDPKVKKAFDDWISQNPALDAIAKSLDCENLGRS